MNDLNDTKFIQAERGSSDYSINVQTIKDFERDIAWGELLDAEKISDHHLKKLLKEDVKDKKELAKLIEPLI